MQLPCIEAITSLDSNEVSHCEICTQEMVGTGWLLSFPKGMLLSYDLGSVARVQALGFPSACKQPSSGSVHCEECIESLGEVTVALATQGPFLG